MLPTTSISRRSPPRARAARRRWRQSIISKNEAFCRPPIESFGDGGVRLLLADSRIALAGALAEEPADLIYLDPPFGTGKRFVRRLRQTDGRPLEAGEAFADGLTDIERYLEFLEPVLRQTHTALRETGSLVVHVDPRTSHYLKVLLDGIYGRDCFRAEIVWCYGGGGTSHLVFPRKHDVLLWYSRSERWTYHEERRPYKENTRAVGRHSTYARDVHIDLERGTPVPDWWVDVPTETGWARQVDFPTAKPRALLKRIVQSLSNPGDLVVDPMLGSGTTALVAAELGRRAIGIDRAPAALVTARGRLLLAGVGYRMWGDFPATAAADIRREGEMIALADISGIEGWAIGGGTPFRARVFAVRSGRRPVAQMLGPYESGDETVLVAYSDGGLVLGPL